MLKALVLTHFIQNTWKWIDSCQLASRVLNAYMGITKGQMLAYLYNRITDMCLFTKLSIKYHVNVDMFWNYLKFLFRGQQLVNRYFTLLRRLVKVMIGEEICDPQKFTTPQIRLRNPALKKHQITALGAWICKTEMSIIQSRTSAPLISTNISDSYYKIIYAPNKLAVLLLCFFFLILMFYCVFHKLTHVLAWIRQSAECCKFVRYNYMYFKSTIFTWSSCSSL